MTCPAPHRLPDSLLFRARSTEYLPRCHQKRCAPNRGVWLLALASAQNCDALTLQSNPMPSVPLQQDYAHLTREPQPNLARYLANLEQLSCDAGAQLTAEKPFFLWIYLCNFPWLIYT